MTERTRADPPTRVTVRIERRARARSPRPATTNELRDQSALGDVLLRSLIRAQLVLALRILATFGAVMIGIPLLFGLSPSLADHRFFDVPLKWLLLGGGLYPLLLLAAHLFVRHAERNEREFVDLVERS